MGPELHLREKLRKIEALFAGAGTLGDVIRKIFGVHQPVPDTHYLIPDLAPSHHEFTVAQQTVSPPAAAEKFFGDDASLCLPINNPAAPA